MNRMFAIGPVRRMMRRIGTIHLPALLLIAAPASGQFAPTAQDRLRALTAPPAVDLYAQEKHADLQRIEAEADQLFGPVRRASIALFVASDCATCSAAEAELRALVDRMGLHMTVLQLDDATKPMFARLGFDSDSPDSLPAYVMQDRLIRGHMPAFVIEGYLSR